MGCTDTTSTSTLAFIRNGKDIGAREEYAASYLFIVCRPPPGKRAIHSAAFLCMGMAFASFILSPREVYQVSPQMRLTKGDLFIRSQEGYARLEFLLSAGTGQTHDLFYVFLVSVHAVDFFEAAKIPISGGLGHTGMGRMECRRHRVAVSME